MKNALIILFSLLCICCKENASKYANTEGEVIPINLEKAFSEITNLEKIKEIFLEEKNDTFPGEIHKSIIYQDTIYLFDNSKAPGVYAYNMQGKFLYSFCQVGQGVGEFINPSDFQVDNNYIYILDPSTNQILYIDKTGKYVTTKKIKERGFSFVIDKEQNIWLDKGNRTKGKIGESLLCQTEDEVLSFVPIKKSIENLNIMPYFSFSNIENKIHYLTGVKNIIYECNLSGVKEKYVLDFGKYWPSERFLEEIPRSHFTFFRKMAENGYITEINFLESSELLLIYFHCKEFYFQLFFNKQTKKQFIIKSPDNIFSRPMSIYNENIVYIENESILKVYKLLWNF